MFESKNAWNRLRWLGLLAFAVSSPMNGQETPGQFGPSDETEHQSIFSGPQPGEKLLPLKARIVIGDNEGQEVDLVSRAKGRPLFLIFMNDFGELPNELMRVMTRYVELRNEPELVTAVVWVASDPNELETKLRSAARRGHMPKKTPVAISLEGPEGPGAYGLNRSVHITLVIADQNVVVSTFALIRPSINAASLAAVPELVKLIGGKPPTVEEILSPRYQQIVTQRVEVMVDKTTRDDRVPRIARTLETIVQRHPDAKTKLGQISSEIVRSGRFNERKQAIGFLRKWAREYEERK